MTNGAEKRAVPTSISFAVGAGLSGQFLLPILPGETLIYAYVTLDDGMGPVRASLDITGPTGGVLIRLDAGVLRTTLSPAEFLAFGGEWTNSFYTLTNVSTFVRNPSGATATGTLLAWVVPA